MKKEFFVKNADLEGRLPEPAMVHLLRQQLLQFYQAKARDLPWRRTQDPYAIWVSEIMLQQTQVKTVLPHYARFMALFPDVHALATATEEQVCEAWAGLGYYRRARHLHKAAKQVVSEFAGHLPNDVQALQGLSGIGRYTAGAIMSIAFGEAVPLVDGNVERVLARLFRVGLAPAGAAGKKVFWQLSTCLVQGERPGDFNQALMELGATVCTPTQPACEQCPVQAFCGALQHGSIAQYPVANVKVHRQHMSMLLVWAQDKAGIWLRRRPLDGLWAGLWELPSAAEPFARQILEQQLGRRLGQELTRVTHELTHRRIEATVLRVVKPKWAITPQFRPYANPLTAPLSGLARKAIVQILQS